MRNLVLLLAMVAAGIAGFAIGSYQGREAKAALAGVEAAAERAASERARIASDLGNRLRTQVADYQREKDRIDNEHRKQQAEWASLLAQRDRQIRALAGASAETQRAMEQIRAGQGAAADAHERGQLASQMGALEAQRQEQQAQLAGLECSRVPVPRELLSAMLGRTE